MKKNYEKIRFFIMFLSIVTLNLEAQLSGVVTINFASPTAGTNYQTFNALATALNTSGVNGPLTVNVATGTYNEQVALNQITGMSATNKITINGNGSLLTFNGTSSAPHTLLLNGTDNLTINDLQMQGTNGTYAMVCILTNAADHNTFSACSFSCPANCVNTTQTPFAISASATGPSAYGNANFNTVKSCTVFSGYYSLYLYGLSTTPYTHDNSFIDCHITDWYYYCVYGYYQKNLTMRGCTFDRMTRSTFTTCYFYYGYYQQGAIFEQNVIKDLFFTNPTNTNTLYGMAYFGYANPVPTNRNTFRNNIVRDIKKGGTTYFMYNNYVSSTNDYYNNTFSFDDPASTGTTYIFYYFYTSQSNTFTNNNFSLTKGGTNYCMYSGGTTTGASVNNNNYYVSGANNYVGYWSSAALTLAAWQSQGPDPVGYNLNPNYVSLATGDLHPTNVALDNKATPMGLTFDNEDAIRNQTTPDIGALEFLTPACAGLPSANAVSSPTYALCPGEVTTLGLATLNTLSGFTYSWTASQTSAVGPFTLQIPGNTTGPFVNTVPVTSNTWYQVVMTCTNPGGGSISPVGTILMAGNTTTTVPYIENFEGIGLNNRLPNCSWSSNSLGDAAQTSTAAASGNRVARSGSSFAYFDNSSPGTNYFYTNSISMNTGITYSAALWYATEYLGNTNWTSLSILVGPNQNPTGMVQVATISPAASGSYKLLSNVFTVPSTGLYYVAIKAVSSAGAAQFLSWDDLSITIPCDGLGAVNAPTVTVVASSPSVCSNQMVNLTASGASSYSWNTGATTSGITDYPFVLGLNNYTVIGTNAVTGCNDTIVTPVFVNDSPFLVISASPATVCAGQPLTLSALGNAGSYQWSTGGNTSAITITINAPATYTVIGTGVNGCISTVAQAVAVYSLPVVTANSSIPDACKDDVITLSGLGATTYQWISNTSGNVLQGSSVNVTLSASTVFTVTGTNSATGCSAKTTVVQNINDCTGINKYTGTSGVKVYPNPTSGEFTIEFNSASLKTIEVMDLTGRIIQSHTNADQHVLVNLNAVANGIYYVKVISTDNVDVIKVVKQ